MAHDGRPVDSLDGSSTYWSASLSLSLKSKNLRDHETLPQKHLSVSATLHLLAWPCIDE